MAIFVKPSLERSCAKELAVIARQEDKLRNAAMKDTPQWKTSLAAKIPPKIHDGLNSAFAKAFLIIFERGTPIIEKTYDSTAITQNRQINEYAAVVKGTRAELRRMKKAAGASGMLGSAVTAVEGIALGALGVGLPDIVVFIGVLLRGAYECALHYGYDYNDPAERMFILAMMEASLSRGDAYDRADAEVELMIGTSYTAVEDELRDRIRRTADTFAVDMLILKFIQGLPLVGMIGGLSDPVYYNKVMKYVRLKYYKRHLTELALKMK
nr:EcsC family protein [Clostridia bacterium]